MPPLQYQPYVSQPSASFWSAVTSLKLDKQGLDDSQITIHGWYEQGRSVIDREAAKNDGSDVKIIGIDGSVCVGADAFGGEGEKCVIRKQT